MTRQSKLASTAVTAMLGALLALPAAAQDFSEGSEATSWNLFGEQKARFMATVTDAVCAITGDCPEDCGAGLRQMVLIRDADAVMLLVSKNGQPVFSGAAVDLAPYCGQMVEVDGLMVGDANITPGLGTGQIYQVQRVRVAGEENWAKTNRFTADWAEKNPDATGEGPWFRRDPRINALIEKEGYLGLGLEADAKYIEENF